MCRKYDNTHDEIVNKYNNYSIRNIIYHDVQVYFEF